MMNDNSSDNSSVDCTVDTRVTLYKCTKPEDLKPFSYVSIPCILFSIQAIILGSFVIQHYWKERAKFVPMMYVMISIVDIANGIGVIHQSILIYLFAYGQTNEDTLTWNFAIFYTVTTLSYRSSVFYNVVLAFSRTMYIMNISTPSYRVRKHTLIIALCVVYPIIWSGIITNDIINSIFKVDDVKMYDMLTFPVAGYNILDDAYGDDNDGAGIVAFNYASFICLYIPFLIPTVIVVTTSIIQVTSLYKSSRGVNVGMADAHRPVTVTVLLISLLFVICNTVFSVYMLLYDTVGDYLINQGNMDYLCAALFGTLLPVLNAAFNPVIIIYRTRDMRREFVKVLSRMDIFPRGYDIGTVGTNVSPVGRTIVDTNVDSNIEADIVYSKHLSK